MQSRHCSGVVLAGGASSRFGGRAKGLALVAGERVVDRVIAAITRVTDEQMLIANDRAIRSAVPRIRSFPDARNDRGSIVGLHSALMHCREAALAVAWDMPFVSADLLGELRRQGEALGVACIPEGSRGAEPLCAYYPRSCLPIVDRQIEDGEMRLADLVRALPDRVMMPRAQVRRFGPLHRLFANVNTLDDLAAARQVGIGGPVMPSRTNAELV